MYPHPELLLFRSKMKPALRWKLASQHAEREATSFTASGASVARLSSSDGDEILFVSHSAEVASALREAEMQTRADAMPSPAHAAIGRLLGYPACCVEAFQQRLAGAGMSLNHIDDEDAIAAADALTRSKQTFGRLNYFHMRTGDALISFYPCRFDCHEAMGYADAALALVPSDSAVPLRTLLMQPVARRSGLTIEFDDF
jgi:hypothetical protein